MSRTVSSSAVTRGRKASATTGSPLSIVSLAARPRAPGASKRKEPSSSVGCTSGAGPSSAGASTTPPKRARRASTTAAADPSVGAVARVARRSKAESSKKEKPEKRLTRYIQSPNSSTSERITRAYQHRLYLIDKKLMGDPNSPHACHFNVLGSTGNVYEVKLQQRPSCTCPDFPRSGLCKHILFVMLRVLKLDRFDPRVWQKSLLTSELKELLEISATSDGVLASQSVRQRFQEIQRSSGKLEDEPTAAPPKTVQREITGDCPICYEQMDNGSSAATEPVIFCRVCGNNVHRDCFDRWSSSKISSGGQTTCIYCRAVWSEPDTNTKGKLSSDYVNLADVSGIHQHTSLEELYPETHRWIGFHGRGGRGRGRGR